VKIGVYLDGYRPEDGGGFTMRGEIFRALLGLSDETHHEFVVISRSNKQLRTEVESAGLQWQRYDGPGFGEKLAGFLVRSFPSLRKRIASRSSLEKRLRSRGVEFVWFVGPRPFEFDLPYLAPVWDLQHRKQPWFPEVSERAEWETRERRIAPFLRRAAAVVVGTEAGKQEASFLFQIPQDRIHALPHPTPSYALREQTKLKAPFGLEAGYLFYPAQFWAHKNHVNLLYALKELRAKNINPRLVLAGSDFGNRSHIEKIVTELNLQDQVRLLGFVSTRELVALYQNALALTYVSYFGPENLPPLEAFGLGCPVIAANVDGAEEQFGKAALLVNPSDPNEIAQAIHKVYKDPKLQARLISAGKKRARQWSSEDFVRGIFKILDEFEPIRRNWSAE
jgi:glycosyltransferase involved in cell wall biosynthesis